MNDLSSTVSDEADKLLELTYWIIHNASSNNWKGEFEEWQRTAVKWRHDYHKLLTLQTEVRHHI